MGDYKQERFADRLGRWLAKRATQRVQLVHEQALGAGLVVASWEPDDLRAEQANPVATILDAMQEHADATRERCSFLVQAVSGTGRPLGTLPHKLDPAELDSEGAALASEVAPNAIVGQLLAHIAGQQKVMNGSVAIVLTAYERALSLQQAIIDRQREHIDGAPKLAGLPEDERVTELKLAALTRLAELGPDIGRLLIAVTQERLAPRSAGVAPTPIRGNKAP